MALAMLTVSAFADRDRTAVAAARPVPQKMSTPALSCFDSTQSSITVRICGGAQTGAPAGFSIQWLSKAAFDSNGGVWPTDETQFCKASFSGVPGCSNYNLAANECINVNIGDNLFDDCGASSQPCLFNPLQCGTQYVFRAFAHANSTYQRSDFTPVTTCNTDPCGPNENCCTGGCTFTQGYWKTHGPDLCRTGNNSNVWPADVLLNGLTLGNVTYTADQLCSILNTPTGGNGLISLAHQLIAAELNIANGACAPQDVVDAIASANTLIGSLVIPPVGAGFLAPSAIGSLTNTLDQFNQGLIGPGHCE